MRASEIAIRNHSEVAQRVWIFDSDGSSPEGMTLPPGNSASIRLKNQHLYFLYSVGFGKVAEWNSSNPEEQLDPNELSALLVDIEMHPRSDLRWEVVSWFPSETVQGNDQCSPAIFIIDSN